MIQSGFACYLTILLIIKNISSEFEWPPNIHVDDEKERPSVKVPGLVGTGTIIPTLKVR